MSCQAPPAPHGDTQQSLYVCCVLCASVRTGRVPSRSRVRLLLPRTHLRTGRAHVPESLRHRCCALGPSCSKVRRLNKPCGPVTVDLTPEGAAR